MATAFAPLSLTVAQSNAYGAASTGVFRSEDLYERLRPKGSRREIHTEEKGSKSMSLLVAIIITIILFVAGVAFYDIIKAKISNYYAREALFDPSSDNSESDIERTLIANEAALHANITFFLITFISAMIILPVLFYFYGYV
jgi:hypothetical protein